MHRSLDVSANSFNFINTFFLTDACLDKPCENDGKCIVSGDGYKCECELFRSGKHCEKGEFYRL